VAGEARKETGEPPSGLSGEPAFLFSKRSVIGCILNVGSAGRFRSRRRHEQPEGSDPPKRAGKVPIILPSCITAMVSKPR
jgi:hypothetical protein